MSMMILTQNQCNSSNSHYDLYLQTVLRLPHSQKLCIQEQHLWFNVYEEPHPDSGHFAWGANCPLHQHCLHPKTYYCGWNITMTHILKLSIRIPITTIIPIYRYYNVYHTYHSNVLLHSPCTIWRSWWVKRCSLMVWRIRAFSSSGISRSLVRNMLQSIHDKLLRREICQT